MSEQDFWQNEARSLFVGVVLYLLAASEKVKSFGDVVRTMRSDDVVYNHAVALDTMDEDIDDKFEDDDDDEEEEDEFEDADIDDKLKMIKNKS
ncbi:hypothetical protein AVEN_96684-1 [Araneus ventricosus]|uniref:Uncharacterized protein n=1 Tax=Araneus ventricosus TaxID=182803 RepID=A0A4Y2EAS4_ARAVE|nr:hypothetical protein AVEN_96684-1 [Araneus ventricosus]